MVAETGHEGRMKEVEGGRIYIHIRGWVESWVVYVGGKKREFKGKGFKILTLGQAAPRGPE